MDALRSYTKKSFLLMASEAVLQLKSCIVLPLVTKLFGVVSYGIWSQVEVLQSLLAPIIIMGLDSAAMRFAPGRPQEEIRSGLASVLLYCFGVGGLVSLALWGTSRELARSFFGGDQNSLFVMLCIPALLAMALNIITRTFFFVIGSANVVAFLRAGEGILLLVPLLWVLISKGYFLELVVGNIIVQGILGLAALVLLLHTIPPRRPDLGLLKGYLRYGVIAMPAGYAVWILNLADRFFISTFRGLGELGVYSSVYSLAYIVISLFFNPFWGMYPAQAAVCYNEGRLDDLRRLYRHSTRLATMLVVPASAGLAVLGPAILKILTTAEFVHGARLLPLISLSYLLSMYGAYFSINLALMHKPHLTTLAMYAAAACNIALNILLIPKWGIAGAAVATLAAFGLQFGLEWLWSRRLFKRHMGFDWKGMAKAVAGSGVMALALWSVGLQNSDSLLALPSAVVLGATIYALSQLLLRNLTGNEFRQVLGLVRLENLTNRFPLRGLVAFLDGCGSNRDGNE